MNTADIAIMSVVGFLFHIGAVRSKGPVVQYTQDLTSTGTQFKPVEPPQPIVPPAPPAPPLSPQAGDNE
jgi:histone-lysine N-methyltransferase SETDB1